MQIHLLSSPRNVSTALMYSFAQRSDMSVIDEPFYAYYLTQSSVEHPGKDEILQSLPSDLNAIQQLLRSATRKEHLFIKGMAHHLKDTPLEVLDGQKVIIFIRDPKQLIASFAQVIPQPSMADIGIERQWQLLEDLRKREQQFTVLDSGDLLAKPSALLEALCDSLNIPFERSMLKWKAGARSEDGVWAKYWYSNVHRSECFMQQSTSNRPLPEDCLELYEQSKPYYEGLKKHAISI